MTSQDWTEVDYRCNLSMWLMIFPSEKKSCFLLLSNKIYQSRNSNSGSIISGSQITNTEEVRELQMYILPASQDWKQRSLLKSYQSLTTQLEFHSFICRIKFRKLSKMFETDYKNWIIHIKCSTEERQFCHSLPCYVVQF